MIDLVSIVMPAYNTAQYIADSVASVQRQTYPNWELIIVDDGSTDDTCGMLRPFLSDSRIRLLRNAVNSGAAVSRNRALREARGRWIAFLDSDDLWMPQKLERQIAFMEEHGYHFSYTGYEEINAAGDRTGVRVTGPRRITRAGMFNYCWPGCLTVMYDARKIGLIQIGNIARNNDYAMWLKVCKRADCYLLDACLAEYRRGRGGSISTRSLLSMIAWHYRLFREVGQETLLESLFNTCRNMVFGCYKKRQYVERDDAAWLELPEPCGRATHRTSPVGR